MILITRQRNFAVHTAAALKYLGLSSLILPMFHVRYIYKDLEDIGYGAVIFTSQNAVHAVKHVKWLKNKKIYAVGSSTASALRKLYSSLNVIQCDEAKQNSDNLSSMVISSEGHDSNILYVSGLHTTGFITSRLTEHGYHIKQEIVYEVINISYLSQQALEAIDASINVVLFFSPRTALIFSDLQKKYHIDLHNKTAICISRRTSEALISDTWGDVVISKDSSESSILDAVNILVKR